VIYFAMVAYMLSTFSGLAMWSFMPAFNTFSRSPTMALAPLPSHLLAQRMTDGVEQGGGSHRLGEHRFDHRHPVLGLGLLPGLLKLPALLPGALQQLLELVLALGRGDRRGDASLGESRERCCFRIAYVPSSKRRRRLETGRIY
jgi:hypothetical protein